MNHTMNVYMDAANPVVADRMLQYVGNVVRAAMSVDALPGTFIDAGMNMVDETPGMRDGYTGVVINVVCDVEDGDMREVMDAVKDGVAFAMNKLPPEELGLRNFTFAWDEREMPPRTEESDEAEEVVRQILALIGGGDVSFPEDDEDYVEDDE